MNPAVLTVPERVAVIAPLPAMSIPLWNLRVLKIGWILYPNGEVRRPFAGLLQLTLDGVLLELELGLGLELDPPL
ncbi:MAG: hypothetical protein LRY37_05415 [Alkalibacterium thalassium]|nr:hypothetical protein [Alkalibacterium thalassium]